jgi:hypothetical protein
MNYDKRISICIKPKRVIAEQTPLTIKHLINNDLVLNLWTAIA